MSVSPDRGALADSALETLEALLSLGHSVFVFLYEDGVYFAAKDRDPPQGEHDPAQRLSALFNHPMFECIVCITAAQRRGLTDTDLNPQIRYGGLGEWTNQLIRADRVIQFR